MPGSKVHYPFCIDFCKLIGQDHQRPNQETWDAMPLSEQQSFVFDMANTHLAPFAPPADINKVLDEAGVQVAEDGTLEPLPGNDIVVENDEAKVVEAPPAVVSELIESNIQAEILPGVLEAVDQILPPDPVSLPEPVSEQAPATPDAPQSDDTAQASTSDPV